MSEYKNNENEIKEPFDKIEIPEELDFVIEKAIKKGKRKKNMMFIRLTIAAACIALFIASINLSPALASMLGNIPGLSYLVELVSFDKGLRLAVDNGFAREVNKFSEDKDIKFTVNSFILDSRKLVIEYSIETTGNYNDLILRNVDITDESGKRLEASVGYSAYYNDKFKESKKKDGIIEVKFTDDSKFFPQNIILSSIAFNDYNGSAKENLIEGNWEVGFALDTNLIASKPAEYQVNQEVSLENIKFYIDYIKVYPTLTDVKIRIDKDSKYKFVWFKNMRIEDEKGNIYKFRNGSTYSEYEHLFSFESSYFTKSKKLYFKADGVYCVPKEDKYLIVDLDNKKVIEDGGYDIEYLYHRANVEEAGDKFDFNIAFKIKDEEILREYKTSIDQGISIENKIYDESNNEYMINSVGSRSGRDSLEKIIGIKTMKQVPHILKFKITGAAKGVYTPISVRLK